jgi:hypothetical protein
MAAEKFIRVTCKLPIGVKLSTKAGTLGARRDNSMMDRFFDSFASEVTTTVLESTEPLTLTLECPAAKRDELIAALASLVRDLNAT